MSKSNRNASAIKNKQTIQTLLSHFPSIRVASLTAVFTPPFVRWVCSEIQTIFEAEQNIINVSSGENSHVHIVGDLHGQIGDLLKVLQRGGLPPNNFSNKAIGGRPNSSLKNTFNKPIAGNENPIYIFLGDYVDRGKYSVEVICLLFSLKLLFPNNFILLRGNHESRELTKIFGFANECKAKLNKQCHKHFCAAFNKMPICAIVDNKYFCVHGGISPQLKTINDINAIDRYREVPDSGLFTDLLWSDPSPNQEMKEWSENDRGCSFYYGIDSVQKFLENNHLQCIIRGHQYVPNGYNYPFYPDESVLTVFSATNYSGCTNSACFLTISPNRPFHFSQLLSEQEPLSRAQTRGPLSPELDAKRNQKKLTKKKKGAKSNIIL